MELTTAFVIKTVFYHFLLVLIFFLTGCHRDTSDIVFNSCRFIDGFPATDQIECGFLHLPENHLKPNGRKIQIAFAIIKAEKADERNYPLILLTGGPGGETLSRFMLNAWLDHPVRQDRDIIFFDQRGIQYSTGLPNLEPGLFLIMAEDLTLAEEQREFELHIKKVKEQCEELGINLENYNSYQSARDIGQLMKSLDYEKYNLYGISYGSRLARIVAELYPEYLKGVIYNSPNPPGGDFLIDRLKSYSTALERVFEYCNRDPECGSMYPELRDKYWKSVVALEKTPILVELDEFTFMVNPQDALYILRRQLYRSDSRTNIPRLIDEIHSGGGPVMSDILESEYHFLSSYNSSMWIAVERFETFNLSLTDEYIDAAYKSLDLFPAQLGMFTSIYKAGKHWHNGSATQKEMELTISFVPSIIFVNRYDPVTPPENGIILQQSLSHSRLFVLDEGGHGSGNMECRNRIMIEFMDDTDGELDISCLNLFEE